MIVDTTVWMDYLRGTQTPQTDWLEIEFERQRIGLTDLNLCEALQGIRADRHLIRVHRELRTFEIFTTDGIELATEAARNYRKLRTRGYTVRKTIDCLIATFCLTNGHALLHIDRDFVPFEQVLGLSTIHP